MRVLHVITSLLTGGAETMVVNMLIRLHADGYEVGVALFNGERTPLMDRLERECPACRIYRLGTSYYNPILIFRLAKVMWKYDIIHTHNSSPQLFAALADIVCRKPLVTTEHSTNNRKRERGGLLRIVDRMMYGYYDRIACISLIAENKLRIYLDTTSDRIVTIQNGVDVNFFHNAKPLVSLRDGRFAIVMVAGFREAKDQDTLLKALALLPKDRFVLWLVGDGERRGVLELLTADLQLTDNVRFLGLRTDVANVIQAADCIVMSSHWEGLSLSNIEGMSAGKPFVASRVNGLKEVTEGYGLLFEHGNAAELATILQQLHDDKKLYQEVADRCYERALQFDIADMVAKYNELYSIFVR